MQNSKENRVKSKTILSKGMFHRLFSDNLVLSPQLNEVYELALAYYESKILTETELVQNGAYFARVGNQFTHHYLMCTGESVRLPQHSSSRLKSFFEKNQFRTGYASHGLFPYRGKFHPQMIKALINVMGLKPGDTVLDPMMGSGTVPVEASLMGVESIGLDASPFCRFMSQVKYNALSLSIHPLDQALKNTENIFKLFSYATDRSDSGNKKDKAYKKVAEIGILNFITGSGSSLVDQLAALIGTDKSEVLDFLLLAYFDSVGYSERSKRKSPFALFQAILERYIFVVKKIQQVLQNSKSNIADSKILLGDARAIKLEDQCIDGIIFSPPYSFAINYLENDAFHLNSMGVNMDQLKEKMVGLRGKTLKEKYKLYVEDMARILSECARVLRPDCFCTIIIGTNDNQLSKALSIPKEQVKGLHKIIIDLASDYGLSPVRTLSRQISGMANTMRNEYIVILQRKDD
jgi:tRNA G10  N-methylase Trm11